MSESGQSFEQPPSLPSIDLREYSQTAGNILDAISRYQPDEPLITPNGTSVSIRVTHDFSGEESRVPNSVFITPPGAFDDQVRAGEGPHGREFQGPRYTRFYDANIYNKDIMNTLRKKLGFQPAFCMTDTLSIPSNIGELVNRTGSDPSNFAVEYLLSTDGQLGVVVGDLFQSNFPYNDKVWNLRERLSLRFATPLTGRPTPNSMILPIQPVDKGECGRIINHIDSTLQQFPYFQNALPKK